MRAPRMLRLLAAALLAAAVTADDAAAQPCSSPYLVTQTFTRGAYSTEWQICWSTPATYGLAITSASFRPGPGKPLVRVFYDARVTEIFVPYHTKTPRYYDLSGFNFPLMALTANDCPAAQGGTLLGSPALVCREIRNRGIGWKNSDGSVYRGQEVVLWSALQAGNYVYLIRWTFRDDGTVLGEIGATGTNLPSMPGVAHMHNAMWRLDIDMNGAASDNVHRVSHAEPDSSATDSKTPISVEQGLAWSAPAFTHLHLFDSLLKNSRGHNSGYMLIPMRTGTARHFEAWTKNDFWVTPYDPSQMRPANLPTYVSAGRSVANTDVVLWYWGSAHHMFRDEDGCCVGGGSFSGTAQAMFAGFMLKPQDLFDAPPFWP
jgi:Cu2+-containing amine oxidase